MSSEYEAANPIFSIPPREIRRLVDNLFSEAGSNVESIAAADIPTDVLYRLNTFAASVAQVTRCNVMMLHKCPSCYDRKKRGNLVDTDSGTECWQC